MRGEGGVIVIEREREKQPTRAKLNRGKENGEIFMREREQERERVEQEGGRQRVDPALPACVCVCLSV